MGFEIGIDVDFPDHRKTRQLQARLQDPQADVYPLRLWLWAAKYARSGVIKGGPTELEGVVKWRGAPLKLARAMKACGFIDPKGWRIHGWENGIGRALLAYDLKKFRLREAYAKKHGLPFTDLPPVLGSLPEENGSILLSQSNPSQNNQTQSPSPNGGGNLPAENRKRRGRGSRPTLDDIERKVIAGGDRS